MKRALSIPFEVSGHTLSQKSGEALAELHRRIGLRISGRAEFGCYEAQRYNIRHYVHAATITLVVRPDVRS